MIKEVKMYTVICDNCGKDAGDSNEYSCWGDESTARDNALDKEWQDEKGEEYKHYCPGCFLGFDDNDKIILTPKP